MFALIVRLPYNLLYRSHRCLCLTVLSCAHLIIIIIYYAILYTIVLVILLLQLMIKNINALADQITYLSSKFYNTFSKASLYFLPTAISHFSVCDICCKYDILESALPFPCLLREVFWQLNSPGLFIFLSYAPSFHHMPKPCATALRLSICIRFS